MSYQQRKRSEPNAAWGQRWLPAPIPSPFSARLGRAATRIYLRHLFGAEHIDRHYIPKSGAAILVSNHPTIGDPFAVAFGTKRWVTWLAFDEALDWPVAGSIMRVYNAIPINLERPKPSSIKTVYGTLARGRVLGMFFEGERSFHDGLNSPLKTGAARIAIKVGAPIVPVTVSGARRGWPRGQALPRPGKMVIRYHPPIDPTTFRPDLPRKRRGQLLTDELERIIGRALPPGGRPWFDKPH